MRTPGSLNSLMKHAAKPLFADAKPSATQAAAETNSIVKLVKEAKAGNPNAIELLMNFACGEDDSHGSARAQAEQSMVDLFFGADTKASIKKEIGLQAFHLYELGQQSGHTLKVPFKLLFLAERHADAQRTLALDDGRNADALVFTQHTKTISGFFEAATMAIPIVFGSPADPMDVTIDDTRDGFDDSMDRIDDSDGMKTLLNSGRVIDRSELVCEYKSRNLPHPANPVFLIGGDIKGGRLHTFNQKIADMASALKPGEVASALYLADGHWIPVAFQHDGNRINWFALDSSPSETRHPERDLKKLLGNALGHKAGSAYFRASKMQEFVPNACGALSSLFLERLREQIKRDGEVDIKKVTEDYLRHWHDELRPDQQKDVVTQIRCNLVVGWAMHGTEGSRFA
ncbi:MAG: hypothetical protein JWQ23_2917 [Herminiimonas sp.]|nr:hypothetical protein [Herminiimonas sp.]